MAIASKNRDKQTQQREKIRNQIRKLYSPLYHGIDQLPNTPAKAFLMECRKIYGENPAFADVIVYGCLKAADPHDPAYFAQSKVRTALEKITRDTPAQKITKPDAKTPNFPKTHLSRRGWLKAGLGTSLGLTLWGLSDAAMVGIMHADPTIAKMRSGAEFVIGGGGSVAFEYLLQAGDQQAAKALLTIAAHYFDNHIAQQKQGISLV